MIQVNELRIGNWVETYSVMLAGSWYDKEGKQHGQDVLTEPTIRQKQIDILDLKIISESPLATYRPIPLTPEILIACGFHKHNNAWVTADFDEKNYMKDYFTVWNMHEGEYKLNTTQFAIEITSLHQLQNLYFSLTQTELNYKP
jgi:hypothetical protein